MSCILRVSGVDLDIDALVSSLLIAPYRIDRKGERRRPHSDVNFELHNDSELHFEVGTSDDIDLAAQIVEAIRYLETYHGPIGQMMVFPGVDGGRLDFQADWKEYAIQCDYLPPELLRLAGSLNLGIEISHYLVMEDEQAPTAGG